MEYEQPKFRLMGDRSLLVELGDDISREVNQRVRMLYYSLIDRKLGGVVELIPSYATLLIIFDPLKISLAALKASTPPVDGNRRSVQDTRTQNRQDSGCLRRRFRTGPALGWRKPTA